VCTPIMLLLTKKLPGPFYAKWRQRCPPASSLPPPCGDWTGLIFATETCPSADTILGEVSHYGSKYFNHFSTWSDIILLTVLIACIARLGHKTYNTRGRKSSPENKVPSVVDILIHVAFKSSFFVSKNLCWQYHWSDLTERKVLLI